MAFGDHLRTENFSFNTNTLTLTSPVAVGNTILVFTNSSNAGVAVSDNVNGAYTKSSFIQPGGASAVIFFCISTSAATAPTITIANHGNRAAASEIAGSLEEAGVSGAFSATAQSGETPWTTTSETIPGTSVSLGVFAASAGGSTFTLDSPWSLVSNTLSVFNVGHRKDSAQVTDAYSGTYNGLSSSHTVAAVFASFTDAGAAGPTLNSVPATAYDGQTLNITGTNLTGATADFGGETASVSVVSDTEINVTIAQGGLKFATHTLTVTTSGGSATSDIELIVEPGTGDFINVVDPNTTDTTAFAYQVEDSLSNPVVTGDQFQWRYTGLAGDVTAMTVGADTRPTSLDQEGDVEGRFWDATDSTWAAWYTFTAAVPDELAPTVSSVGVPTAGSYKAGDTLSFTVNFSEVVTVTGTPQLPIIIGGVTRQADYASGSGSSALVFSYTVQTGENDADGIGVGSAIGLNGGTIVDQAATPNAANLTLNSVGSTAGVLVDTIKPIITPPSPNPLNITVGGTFTNTPASATDNQDGSLGTVAGVHTVDTNTIGQYTITYPGAGVVDSAGNVSDDATRIVNVVEEDYWPFSPNINYAAPKTWTWGGRHPKTNRRVRIFK